MSRTARNTAPAAVTYRIESVEAAVKATIRQVTCPAVRDAMWSAWQEALAAATADSPDRLPWEKASDAVVITQESAHQAMVRMLEAITDIGSRRGIRDLLALESEFIDTESGEGTGPARQCEFCGRPYRSAQPKARYCRPNCRSAAHKKRMREAARESGQSTTGD